MCAHLKICLGIYIYRFKCLYKQRSACIYLIMILYLCVWYIYIYIYIYIYMHADLSLFLYIHVYLGMCLFVYTYAACRYMHTNLWYCVKSLVMSTTVSEIHFVQDQLINCLFCMCFVFFFNLIFFFFLFFLNETSLWAKIDFISLLSLIYFNAITFFFFFYLFIKLGFLYSFIVFNIFFKKNVNFCFLLLVRCLQASSFLWCVFWLFWFLWLPIYQNSSKCKQFFVSWLFFLPCLKSSLFFSLLTNENYCDTLLYSSNHSKRFKLGVEVVKLANMDSNFTTWTKVIEINNNNDWKVI